MTIYRLMFTEPGGVHQLDVIEHADEFWIVPEWLATTSPGLQKPARIVRLASLPHSRKIGGRIADFVVSFGVPKAAVFGLDQSGQPLRSEVVEAPDIQVAIPVRH